MEDTSKGVFYQQGYFVGKLVSLGYKVTNINSSTDKFLVTDKSGKDLAITLVDITDNPNGNKFVMKIDQDINPREVSLLKNILDIYIDSFSESVLSKK